MTSALLSGVSTQTMCDVPAVSTITFGKRPEAESTVGLGGTGGASDGIGWAPW